MRQQKLEVKNPTKLVFFTIPQGLDLVVFRQCYTCRFSHVHACLVISSEPFSYEREGSKPY